MAHSLSFSSRLAALSAAAGIAALSVGAFAQTPAPVATATAGGHPDFTGMWTRIREAEGIAIMASKQTTNEEGQTTVNSVRDGNVNYLEVDQEFTIKSEANVPVYKPEHWATIWENEEFGYERPADPGFGCKNPGVVKLATPVEIVQMPTKIILIYQGAHVWIREVPLDGRALPVPDAYDGTRPMGTSVGHWDGQSLVIETVDFPTDGVWYATRGWFSSPEAKITERFTPVGANVRIETTVDDPAFVRPWIAPAKAMTRNASATAMLVQPLPCIERDAEFLPGGK